LPLPARRRARLLVACVIAMVCAAPVARADNAAELFGTRELFSADLVAFTKWDGVVARTDREARNAGAPCRSEAPGQVCVAQEWRDFVAELSALPLRQRIARANEVLNRVRYVSATANWHDPDHWETPYEFLARGGQCQDYAIAKFMALAESGVPQAALRFVVVHDLKTALDHAVTVVYVDGEALVLDNQVRQVVPASHLRRYVPYYSINRTGWWYHVPRTPAERLQIARAATE
jgi:predicted transglutaminase-like cysteine proteinase